MCFLPTLSLSVYLHFFSLSPSPLFLYLSFSLSISPSLFISRSLSFCIILFIRLSLTLLFYLLLTAAAPPHAAQAAALSCRTRSGFFRLPRTPHFCSPKVEVHPEVVPALPEAEFTMTSSNRHHYSHSHGYPCSGTDVALELARLPEQTP